MADQKQHNKGGKQGAGPKHPQSPVIKPGTGSGSRPNAGSHKIKDSAPEHTREMGKAPKGWLK